jgi:hypothetical protein
MNGKLKMLIIKVTHNTKQNLELLPPPPPASHQILFYHSREPLIYV